MVEAKQLFKNYGSIEVLKGVDLTINQNEIVAIVGPSGAGKTTLLQILGTLDRPEPRAQTRLHIADKEVLKLKEDALATFRNKQLGFVFQFHELLPEFSALENVCLPTWISNMDSKKAKSKAINLLTELGVAHRMHHRPNALSGGEQQRVAVARALINEPQLVLADEPSGNLDSENAKQLHELFFQLKSKTKCSFVIVTHNDRLAAKADRIIRLSDGMITA
ncbi:MAG: ABC transporter ATP-binding protein [Flavobacteriaceae bacterium]|nr:ABC transporter ATP-binding protein [Flavobacteriaceae bacterium]